MTKTWKAFRGGLWVAMLLGKPSPDIRLAAPGRAGGQAELRFQSHLRGR